MGGSNSGSNPGQVVNSWTKSKSKQEEEKPKHAEASAQSKSKQEEKEEEGNVRIGGKTNNAAQDLPTKETEVLPRFTLKVNMSNKHLIVDTFKNSFWNLKSTCKQYYSVKFHGSSNFR